MIRLVRPAEPAVLAGDGAAATIAMCEAHDRGESLPEFDSSIYAHPTVKEALLAAQAGKCAFCESFVQHIAYGDIEHFRPKKGYRQQEVSELKSPGYFWLAYNWHNLLFACQLCNQRFKRNHFPLRDGRRRARPTIRDTSREEPLFLNPFVIEPRDLISFHREVAVAVNDCREGAATIHSLGLNRDALVEVRRQRWEDLRTLIRLIERLRATGTPGDLAEVSDYEEMLRRKLAASGEYSAMANAYVENRDSV